MFVHIVISYFLNYDATGIFFQYLRNILFQYMIGKETKVWPISIWTK